MKTMKTTNILARPSLPAMQNRRQHFRYAFTPKSYWKATFHHLDTSTAFSAEIVNLSIGGICVKVDAGHLAEGKNWIVAIALSTHDEPLRIPVEWVHPHVGESGLLGFRFLPLPNAMEQEEQDRLIWRFILEEQRRDRREAARSKWWAM
jgi:c-di-GMP-binding flagellar brake protein YcgR